MGCVAITKILLESSCGSEAKYMLYIMIYDTPYQNVALKHDFNLYVWLLIYKLLPKSKVLCNYDAQRSQEICKALFLLQEVHCHEENNKYMFK